MDNIKPLKWNVRTTEDNIPITEAMPKWLKHSYYIDLENNQYKLTFMEELGQKEDNKLYPTIESAKIAAEKHYTKIVRSFLIN